MNNSKRQLACPPAATRARREPPRLGLGNRNLWEDFREVLLDSDPDPGELELVRRWLRDEVERELLGCLAKGRSAELLRQACRVAPRLIWSLPFSRATPSPSHHRRIVAILLPHKLRQVEQQLAIHAFHEGLDGAF